MNNSALSQGSKASRPIGVKKAKKRAKSEAEHSISVPLAGVQVLEAEGITTMPKELAAGIFKVNVAMKQKEIKVSLPADIEIDESVPDDVQLSENTSDDDDKKE